MSIPVQHKPHTPWARSVALGVILAAVVTIILLAFLWPSVTASPKGIPIVLAGPTAQTSQVETGIKSAAPGIFTYTHVDDRAAAVSLIRENKDYGAIVLGSA